MEMFQSLEAEVASDGVPLFFPSFFKAEKSTLLPVYKAQ